TLDLLRAVDGLGGAAGAIEASFFQEEIARSAYDQQMRVEHGQTVIVGVNKFGDKEPPPIIPAPDYSALERDQVGRLKASRDSRDAARAAAALGALRDAAKASDSLLMPVIIDAARARASVGEIADSLREAWGEYRP